MDPEITKIINLVKKSKDKKIYLKLLNKLPNSSPLSMWWVIQKYTFEEPDKKDKIIKLITRLSKKVDHNELKKMIPQIKKTLKNNKNNNS